MLGTGQATSGGWGPSPATVEAIIDRVLPTIAEAVPRPQAAAAVAAALARYRARHPDAASPDSFTLTRLVTLALDRSGTTWQEQAGLLATDSCGYPVAGGLADIRSDLAVNPVAVAHPRAAGAVQEALMAQWRDQYVATGSVDLGLPWQQYLADEVQRESAAQQG